MQRTFGFCFLARHTYHMHRPPYLLMFVYRRQRSYTSFLGESVRSRHGWVPHVFAVDLVATREFGPLLTVLLRVSSGVSFVVVVD